MTKQGSDPEDDMENQMEKDAQEPEIAPADITANAEAEAMAKAQQELLYLRADLENSKKRLLRETEQSIKFANERFLSELLPVVDLFELALGSSAKLREKGDKDFNNYMLGIEMTHKQLLQTLEKIGAEMIGKVGERFDPSRHEAVSQVVVQEAEKVGTILQVANRGCLFHGRLVKPARVVVGESQTAQE